MRNYETEASYFRSGTRASVQPMRVLRVEIGQIIVRAPRIDEVRVSDRSCT